MNRIRGRNHTQDDMTFLRIRSKKHEVRRGPGGPDVLLRPSPVTHAMHVALCAPCPSINFLGIQQIMVAESGCSACLWMPLGEGGGAIGG